MSNDAPFCNVKGVTIPGTPQLPSLQPIPKATDLPSALRAIQAMTNNFNTLYNTFVKTGNFVELRQFRTTEIVRIYNPQDASQFVDVQQITGLTFQDPVTGRLLTWKQ